MDLPSYYRHQAYSALQLVGAYQEQRQTKAALERVAQEYESIAQDLEKWCGQDPASRCDLVTYIDAYRARCAVAAFDAEPVDQPIKVSREARANTCPAGPTERRCIQASCDDSDLPRASGMLRVA